MQPVVKNNCPKVLPYQQFSVLLPSANMFEA